MKAVVLVGGEGTRLRPLTLGTPKPMLPIADVTMIERVVTHLAAHGIDEVVLSLGYQPEAFLVEFPDNTCAGVRLVYAVEPEPLDTAGGIAFAARHAGLDAGTAAFLVVNGDVLTDLDITALAAFHRARGAEATISLTPVENPFAFGLVLTDDAGSVSAFLEPSDAVKKGIEVPTEPAPTNLINAGYYIFEPSVISRIPAAERIHIESATFPEMASAGTLYATASTEYWTDTGTPALYLQANLDYAAGLRGTVPAPGSKERAPGVWTLGAGVIDGTVVGPSLIGDAAYIASGATVEGSVIGAGARVESGALVRGSLLLAGAVVRAGALVEASIVGDAAVVGAGAQLRDLTVVQGRAVVEDGAVLSGGRVST